MYYNPLMNGLGALPMMNHGRSRAINAENPKGEKGKGGMAASHLGASRKGSPCLTLPKGETVTLAEIDGCGVIEHIWITVTDRTSERDCFVLRDLVLRMYWDGICHRLPGDVSSHCGDSASGHAQLFSHAFPQKGKDYDRKSACQCNRRLFLSN